MDKNTIIGFLLIFAIVIAWQQFMKPSAAEIAEQRLQDSLRMEQGRLDSLAQLPTAEVESPLPDAQVEETAAADDSLAQVRFAASFGPFAPAAQGEEKEYVLENELLKLVISSKGGRIVEAELKQYKKIREGEKNKEIEEPLLLLEDDKNRFEYLLPVAGLPAGLSTADLYFSAETGDNTLTMRAPTTTGAYFEQTYSLEPGTYHVDYVLNWQGLENVLDRQQSTFELNWLNYLDKLEKNTSYERNYSTVYFKPVEESVEHCSCTGTDQEQVDDQRLKWVSNTNQFFNSTLIAETGFQSGSFETEVLDLEADDLKKLHSRLAVPYGESTSFDMDFYIGPNEFERLASYGLDLQDVVPFGRSIFGTVNRWVIRPIFSFLSKFIGSKGIVILMLTLIVKLLLYPLTYRMLYSQSKMGALKPHLANLKEKFKDDPQKQQMETMKIYQEFGVNPLGGCLPVVAQMPIWFALYRFFPASIEFRQESFLWATDLSSYDVAFSLPTEIPFYGDHVSMFTILWAITTVIYTYYNTRHMDMSVNPAMKYMQYFMPIMFLFFFNSFASGLTCYLLFSNLLNITQTIVTKNYLIDNDKLSRELEAYRSKPKKKKKGFQARLEAALKEQQRQQAERDTKNKKKKGQLMGGQTCMLLAVILAFFSCHRQVSPVPADPSAILLPVAGSETASAATKKAVKALPEIRKKEVATYQRTPCYGKCPVFRVVWYSDGSVMYIGSAYVDKRGYYRAAPGRTAIGALLESVAELGFFDLADQYPPNGPFPTEFPNIIISLQQGDFEKKVVHNHLAPPNLLQIETLLEEWLDRQSWEAFTP